MIDHPVGDILKGKTSPTLLSVSATATVCAVPRTLTSGPLLS